MSVRGWLLDRFFSDLVDERVDSSREAVNRSKQVEGFRRLTESKRDLNPVMHDRQREIAVYLYTYNPLARRLLETIREWVVGEGITIAAPNDRTRGYLVDQFWNGRGNRWPRRLWDQTLELYLMGERFLPVFTNEHSGLMRFGTIDPSQVKEVITDPDNIEMTIGVVLKTVPGVPERCYRTVLVEEDIDLLSDPGRREWEGRLSQDGELFTFAVNKLSTQKRGISELFGLADWLDGYEQLLFSILQREQALGRVFMDVTLEGYDQAQIEEWLQKQKYPSPLSLNAHNEKVSYEVKSPGPGVAAANTEHARLFRNHILGGQGQPEHWYGGGGDVNRATAAEMGTPTEKSLTAKQGVVREIVEDILRAQVARGVEHGEILDREADAREFTAEFPEPSTRDLAKIASSIQSMAAGMVLLGREGWIDDETPARVITSLVQQLGVEVDPDEMMERARDRKSRTLADEATAALDRRLPVAEA